jgi:prevent-host-death family protein
MAALSRHRQTPTDFTTPVDRLLCYNMTTCVGTIGGVVETVGVRQLKEHASEILRRVREEGDIFEVTYHGRVVARLVPVAEPEQSTYADAFLGRWERLSAEISARWPEGVSAVEAVREARREL